jgi:hypothetical protein
MYLKEIEECKIWITCSFKPQLPSLIINQKYFVSKNIGDIFDITETEIIQILNILVEETFHLKM